MNFSYDFRKGFYSSYNFANGIILKKKSIKKHPNRRIYKFTTQMLYYFLYLLLIFIAGVAIYAFNRNESFLNFLSFLVTFLFFMLIFYWIVFFIYYFISRKNTYGKLIIDENGITDSTIDITITYPWDKVDFCVIKNDFAVIVFQSLFFVFIINNFDRKKLIEEIHKYRDDLLIILHD